MTFSTETAWTYFNFFEAKAIRRLGYTAKLKLIVTKFLTMVSQPNINI